MTSPFFDFIIDGLPNIPGAISTILSLHVVHRRRIPNGTGVNSQVCLDSAQRVTICFLNFFISEGHIWKIRWSIKNISLRILRWMQFT